MLDVVGQELLRPIHDQVSQLDHGHEVRAQLAASVVDAVRHLALRLVRSEAHDGFLFLVNSRDQLESIDGNCLARDKVRLG